MVSIFFSILMIFRDKSECRTNSTCTDLMVANSTLASAFSKFSCRISSDGRANRYASKMRMVSNTNAIPTQINASLVFKGKMNILLVEKADVRDTCSLGNFVGTFLASDRTQRTPREL